MPDQFDIDIHVDMNLLEDFSEQFKDKLQKFCMDQCTLWAKADVPIEALAAKVSVALNAESIQCVAGLAEASEMSLIDQLDTLDAFMLKSNHYADMAREHLRESAKNPQTDDERMTN